MWLELTYGNYGLLGDSASEKSIKNLSKGYPYDRVLSESRLMEQKMKGVE